MRPAWYSPSSHPQTLSVASPEYLPTAHNPPTYNMALTPGAQRSEHYPPALGRRDNDIYKLRLPYCVDSGGLCPLRKEVKHHISMHFTSATRRCQSLAAGEDRNAFKKGKTQLLILSLRRHLLMGGSAPFFPSATHTFHP